MILDNRPDGSQEAPKRRKGGMQGFSLPVDPRNMWQLGYEQGFKELGDLKEMGVTPEKWANFYVPHLIGHQRDLELIRGMIDGANDTITSAQVECNIRPPKITKE